MGDAVTDAMSPLSDRTSPYDLLIVGGGINGTAIARAAVLAGLRTLLVERNDLGQATSSASTKLIHGGLRYLERFEFRLVREALAERKIMLATAPHLVRPLEFRIPLAPGSRPWPVMRIGLWLYDLLAWGGPLPRSRSLRIADPMIVTATRRGFGYWDTRVDDARLVILNALDAAEAGASIQTRTSFASAERNGAAWHVRLATQDGGEQRIIARMIVNAAGPWADQVLKCGFPFRSVPRLRLVRGSHIITRRCFDGEHAWLFQQLDGRIVFAIPYQWNFTLIGTTDVPVEDPAENDVSPGEVDYLLDAVNRYRVDAITRDQIIWSYAGIRALFDDGAGSASAISRDYHLELNRSGPALLSVFGGKITTARHLAEDALSRLGIIGKETRRRPLPGGDMADFAAFLGEAGRRWPFVDSATLERMAGAYGTRIAAILGIKSSTDDLGRHFGAGLYACEVDYLRTHEWAACAEDILWRRSKLGLYLDAAQVGVLQAYIDSGRA